jgi:pimeloyl-ACP methyl ester carboxylesterase
LGHWSTSGVGAYVASERHVLIANRDYRADGTKRGVLYCPSHGNDATQAIAAHYVDDVLNAVAEAGFPVLSCDLGAGGTSWGNDTAISRFTSAKNYLQGTCGAKAGAVLVYGFSMGGLTALNWARQHPDKVAAAAFACPAVDLADIHDNNRGGYAAEIETAYGGAAGYAAAVAAHNPVAVRAYAAVTGATAGLVSYWRLGEGAGTTAADSKGANTGTYSGGFTLGQAGLLTGDSDKSVLLDGSSGYVGIPHSASLVLTGDMAVEAWVKPSALTASGITVAAKNNTANDTAGPWAFMVDDTGNPRMFVGNGTTQSQVICSQAISAGVVSHLVASISGTTVSFYINGVFASSGTFVQARADSGSEFRIGRQQGQWWQGTLDEVAVYNTALSAATVLDHYEVGAGQYTFPMQLWYASDDTTVVPSTITAFQGAYSANTSLVNMGAVGHSPTAVPPKDVVAFFKAHA